MSGSWLPLPCRSKLLPRRGAQSRAVASNPSSHQLAAPLAQSHRPAAAPAQTPFTSRFHSRAHSCARYAAAVGCFATFAQVCSAAEVDASPGRKEDVGPITLTGVVASLNLPHGELTSRLSKASGEAGMLPGSIEISQARWSAAGTPLAGTPATQSAAQTGGAASIDIDNVSYRMAYGTRRSAVSVGFGAADYRVKGFSGNTAGTPIGGTLPSVSVAWRQQFTDKYRLDVEATKASALGSQLSDSLTSTKVKVEWSAARNTGIGLEQGSLNLKMSSSGRFAMKIKRGGPMFYMRSKF